jgi:ribosomal protein L16 Arg81 hydroxylase
MVDLATWPIIDEILQQPGVDFLCVRDGRLADNPPRDLEHIREFYRQGYTLVIRNAEEHHPALAELASWFHETFRAPVDIHIYCTPADHHGFGWHYDAEDVFIIQTSGEKQYSLRKNTVNPWPVRETLPRDMAYHREIMPCWSCQLEAGDWLYIPNGYWHRAQAAKPAISLAIGVMSTTALDVLDAMRRSLLDSLLWRQRLPALAAASGMAPEKVTSALAEVFSDLADDCAKVLRDPTFIQDFLQAKGIHGRPMHGHRSSAVQLPREASEIKP